MGNERINQISTRQLAGRIMREMLEMHETFKA